MADPEKLGNRLKVLRAEREWTQAMLAERVGVTRKTINTIERSVFVPSTVLSLEIARAFGVPFDQVFWLKGGDDEQGEGW